MGLSGFVAAKVYRWVDEQGQVHFSDKAPPVAEQEKGLAVESIDIEVPKAVENPELKQYRQDTRRRLEALDKENQEAREVQVKKLSEQKKIKAQCSRAKRRYYGAKNSNYLYNYDDKGNKTIHSEDKKQAVEKRLQQIIKKYCQ